MTEGYADPDWEVVDYQMYCLDSEVIDRQTNTVLLLRGPKPQNLESGEYFVCIGAAQTFGRFCERPYPTLLQERLGLQALNLGRRGAGPSFFSKENDKLLGYINGARFAVIQVMAGRSEGNSLDVKEDNQVISLDYEECIRHFTWTQEIKEQYDVFFKDHQKIHILYERLSDHYESEMKHIQEFLGVSHEVLKPSTFKQSRRLLSESIRNYSELKKKFKGTPWDEFFEE